MIWGADAHHMPERDVACCSLSATQWPGFQYALSNGSVPNKMPQSPGTMPTGAMLTGDLLMPACGPTSENFAHSLGRAMLSVQPCVHPAHGQRPMLQWARHSGRSAKTTVPNCPFCFSHGAEQRQAQATCSSLPLWFNV